MNLKIKKHISILLAGMLLFVTMPLHSYAGDELQIEYLTKKQSETFDSAFKKSEILQMIVLEISSMDDEDKGKWYSFDEYGKIISDKYQVVYNFSEGLVRVRKDGKYGYIDKSGNEVIACKYDSAWCFRENGFSEYYYVNGFSEGLAWFFKDDKLGCIDKSGNEAIAFKSEDYWSTHALIKHHGRWGFVEKEYLVSPATQKIIEKGIQRDKMMKVAVPAGAFVAIILIPGMLVLYLKKKKRKVALSENSAYVNATEFSNEGVYAGEVQAMDMAGYCTNCGKPYSNSTQFCGGCGQKLQKRQEE